MCCLSKPDDRRELEKIRNKWMTPKELIKVLYTVKAQGKLEYFPNKKKKTKTKINGGPRGRVVKTTNLQWSKSLVISPLWV